MTNIVVGLEPVLLPVAVRPQRGPRWAGGGSVVVQNRGAGIVYLDYDPAVSTATGIELDPSTSATYPLDPMAPLYVVADTADTDVRFFATG